MGGFRSEEINLLFESGVFDSIATHVSKCCDEMKKVCFETGQFLFNDENKITNRLVEKYLNKGETGLRYISQTPENFVDEEDKYKGIIDIKVVTSDWFRDTENYYTIECKRVDGGKRLNKEFVSNGVSRFVTFPPKYTSQSGKNFMLGYVVKPISIPRNAADIDESQSEFLKEVKASPFSLVRSDCSNCFVYSCEYHSDVVHIQLQHIFYDFSNVIANAQKE